MNPTLARRLPALITAALCAAGVWLRVRAVPAGVGDVDSVNHARALAHFDPFAQAPHFPGYPVFTAVTQGFAALGLQDVWALALPGVLLFVPAAALLTRALWGRLGAVPALATLAFAALSPGVVVASAWPSSDGFGFACLLLCAALLLLPSPRAVWWGAFLVGLTLGVRLSYAPLLLSCWGLSLYASETARMRRRSVVAAASGVLVWLLPMVWLLEVEPLLALGQDFLAGHFTRFGGAATTADAASAGDRLARYGWSLWDAGLGAAYPLAVPGLELHGEVGLAGWGIAVCLLACALLALRKAQPHARAWVLAGALCGPYLLWLAVAQNPDKPRHVLPLLPLLGLAVGLTLAQHRRLASTGLPLLGALLLWSTAGRAHDQGQHPVPPRALLTFLQGSPGPSLVLAGPESRVLEHGLPSQRVLRPLDFAVARREARRAHSLGVQVLLTSSIPSFRLTADLQPVQEFRFPVSVRPQQAALTVYRYRPQQAGQARQQRAAYVPRSMHR